jgi:hypothetical protein
MKEIRLFTLITAGLILCVVDSFCQDSISVSDRNQILVSGNQNSGNTKFLLTGYAFSGFEKETGSTGTFGPTGFSPIFLWKKSDRLFFESEVEIEIEDGVLRFNLEYATLHYIINKYATIGIGRFLSPFGTFAERLHPAWIDKFSEMPLGISEEGVTVGPFSELGIELRGGAQLGSSKINYVAYVTNGPALIANDPGAAGQLTYENLDDNNNNKAIGGRLGFLPFQNSSLEIGVSGQTALVGDKDSDYENVRANMFSADVSYIHKVGVLNLDIKGQLNHVAVSNANYKDASGLDFTFDNKSSAYYMQLALRPAFIKNKFIKNLELAGRLSTLKFPENSPWSANVIQSGIGLNYWFTWNSVVKLDYLINKNKGGETENGLFLQVAFGF